MHGSASSSSLRTELVIGRRVSADGDTLRAPAITFVTKKFRVSSRTPANLCKWLKALIIDAMDEGLALLSCK